MKLLIDAGNTHCKYLTVQNGIFSSITNIDTEQINQHWLAQNFATVEQCLVSNVSDEKLNAIISSWCKKGSIQYGFIESEAERFNVQCAYDNPKAFGVDRWLGLLGTNVLFPNQASLIVDSGTATTIDLLSSKGKHQGGWILPGIDLMFSSVINNTSKVQATPEVIEQIKFSSNTSHAVNQANWAATAGLVTTAIATAHKHYLQPSESLNVILTGGNAKQLAQLIDVKSHLIENLIFIGMNRYHAIKAHN